MRSKKESFINLIKIGSQSTTIESRYNQLTRRLAGQAQAPLYQKHEEGADYAYFSRNSQKIITFLLAS